MHRHFTLLLRHELRLVWRDRRALFVAVVLPVLLLPLVLWVGAQGRGGSPERIDEPAYRYALAGDAAEQARVWLSEALRDDTGNPPEEVETADPYAALAEGELDVVLRARSAIERTEPPPADGRAGNPLPEDLDRPTLTLYFRADRIGSLGARQRLEDLLEARHEALRQAALESAELSTDPGTRLVIEDLASAERRRGAVIGRWATLFLLLPFLAGGALVAVDTLAGENERRSLETLLTSAADRRSIVAAKGLAILVLGYTVATVHLANFLLLAGLGLLPATVMGAASLGVVLLVLVLWLPLALLVAAALLWISGWARSAQRFQLGFLPLALLLLLLAATPLLPTAELRSVLSVVPVAGLAVAVREVASGHFDPLALAATWTAAMLVAAAVGRGSLGLLEGDRAVGEPPHPRVGGADARLAGRIAPWWLVSWALVLVAPANFSILTNLHAQLLFNLVVVLLGGTLLMAWGHGLEPRRALGLSLPRPVFRWRIWPVVLLGSPALLAVCTLLARWSESLFPRPEAAQRAWAELAPLAELGTLEALALFAVLPAICEELAFRGLLLHGLRDRLRPGALCMVSGLAFAFFHLEPVRFLPTFVLGTLLAWITLLSRSLLPAILWHALHNGLAVTAARHGLALEALSPAWGVLGVPVTAGLLIWVSFLAQRHHRLDRSRYDT